MSVSRRALRSVSRVACLAVAGAVLGLPSLATADETFVLRKTIVITGAVLHSFDISWVDPKIHSYLLSDRSNKAVDVIDTVSKAQSKLAAGAFVGFTGNNDTSGPNGVLSFHNHGTTEVWAGDGNSTVKVIDFKTGDILHTISTAGVERADELCHDPADRLIVIANDAEADVSGHAPFISFIATEGPHAYTVVKQIQFPEATNGIEQCQWNPRNGLIYLNLPEVNGNGADTTDGQVVVIDPRRMEVITRFNIPVTKCAGPQGMAIGPEPQILLGCNAVSQPPGTGQNAGILDEHTGKLIKVLADAGGADEVWFNPGDGHYFLADGSHATQEQLAIVDSLTLREDPFVVIAKPPGTGHAHSVAADPATNEVYFPIPDNAGSTICPVPTGGCIAIFGPQGRDDPPVYTGH
jgi:DNA-binding beta-propeller fold protein YncE